MNREVFDKYVGKKVEINLKPTNFVLTGTIDYVFEDCFAFTTTQKTSYLDFDQIAKLIPLE